MLPDDRLITLRRWRRVQPFCLCDWGIETRRRLAKSGLDPVVYGEVNGPSRKITKDGRPEATVEPSKTIVQDDIAKGCCIVMTEEEK